MTRYYVNRNAQETGEHEVHKETCNRLPDLVNRIDLGSHSTCQQALAAAKKHFSNVDGCAWCSSACHKK